jgi:hypothetical protein
MERRLAFGEGRRGTAWRKIETDEKEENERENSELRTQNVLFTTRKVILSGGLIFQSVLASFSRAVIRHSHSHAFFNVYI